MPDNAHDFRAEFFGEFRRDIRNIVLGIVENGYFYEFSFSSASERPLIIFSLNPPLPTCPTGSMFCASDLSLLLCFVVIVSPLIYIIERDVAYKHRVAVLRAFFAERVYNAVSAQGFLHVRYRIHIV